MKKISTILGIMVLAIAFCVGGTIPAVHAQQDTTVSPRSVEHDAPIVATDGFMVGGMGIRRSAQTQNISECKLRDAKRERGYG